MDSQAVQAVVDQFWGTRAEQAARLADGGAAGGGARAAGHMQGICELTASLFHREGLSAADVRVERFLPGYYRARKKWDMAVVYQGVLVAALEFKSQVGSVGKNINNRFEEALGTATDTWAAQKKNAAYGEVPPWLGYVFVLEETDETEKTGRRVTADFPVDPAFVGSSYNQRYQEMLSRFLGDNIYQAGWFVTTRREADGTFSWNEPLATASSAAFEVAIKGRVDYIKTVLAQRSNTQGRP